jgi:hypothetical protein
MDYWNSLLQRADIGQSRSSVLNPLQWALVILLGGVLGSVASGAPRWLTIGLAICVFALVALFIAAYVYFMLTDPTPLRSESYSLSKMALERGLMGDNLSGLLTEQKNTGPAEESQQ